MAGTSSIRTGGRNNSSRHQVRPLKKAKSHINLNDFFTGHPIACLKEIHKQSAAALARIMR
jgi:hypothetical protein